MGAATADDLRQRLDAAPMSAPQVLAVAITVLLSALDGYDVLSVTFAAPAISLEWGLGKAALGLVLSAGLAGMALGSFLLAPLADLYGRRVVVLSSLTLMTAGMLLSALASSLALLIAWRVLTGLGIGAMVAVINPLAAEFANARRRPLAVALMTIGYPLGGLVGGLGAAALLHAYSWPAVFVAGAIAAVLLIPVVAAFLPEPLAFLLARRRPDSLQRVNKLLARLGHRHVEFLPAEQAKTDRGYRAVFASAQRGVTVRVTLVNLLFVMAVYYVLSWLPQLVADRGFTPSVASLVSATASVAGVVGGLGLGWWAQRSGPASPAATAMIGLGLATVLFGTVPASLPLLTVGAALCGFFLFGGMAGLYGTLASSFAAPSRASGVGFVIGVGRIGSVAAPLLAGWLFATGLGEAIVSCVFGILAVAAGILLRSASATRR